MTVRGVPSQRPRITHVTVVVPANNEAATITATIESIDRARRRLVGDVTTSVVVVLDDCTDDTFERLVGHRRLDNPESTPPDIVHVRARSAGAARAAGFAHALAGAQVPPDEMWLATTDADTVVPLGWLTDQIALADSGADAVAGIVELGADAPRHVRRGFSAGYVLDADGSHGHVHGANMGMRASSYLASGGWSMIETGEDHDLWHRLGRIGRCISSTAVSVRTSARLAGRAPSGFAADLRSIAETEVVA